MITEETPPEKALTLLSDALARHIEDSDDREEFLRRTISEFITNLEQIEGYGEDVEFLEDMISRGFFPSFSFPLEVADFEVLGTKKKEGKDAYVDPHIWASTSQDLKVALSEFAPGRKITINKQTYQVGGIGIKFPKDPVDHLDELRLADSHLETNSQTGEKEVAEHAKDWKFFHRCITPECGVIFKSTEPSFNLSGDQTCPGCSAVGDDNSGDVVSSRMLTPEVFRPIMKPYKEGIFYEKQDWINNSRIEMRGEEFSYENSMSRRIGRASLPTPLADWDEGFKEIYSGTDDWPGIKLLSLVDAEDVGNATRLLIVNEGPEQYSSDEGSSVKGNGFRICRKCGHVALNSTGTHHRPYAITRDKVGMYVRRPEDQGGEGLTGEEAEKRIGILMDNAKSKCTGEHSDFIVLGHEFRTDIVVLRFPIRQPLTNKWNTAFFEAAVRAIKEALITEVTNALNLMDREIGGNYRKILLPRGDGSNSKDQFIDIFLYDQVSGGAGLVSQIHHDIENNPEHSIEYILDQVEKRLGGYYCGKGKDPCQRVCNCLLDFRNKMEHERMSRPLGLQLLRYMRTREAPDFDYFTTIKELEVSSSTELLIEQLTQVFLNSGITISGPDKHGVIEVTKSGNIVRKFRPYSILVGHSALPGNSPLIWDSVPSQRNRLDDDIVHIPYELLRDAPHMLNEILFSTQNGGNPSNPMDMFGDA